jgi:hypothetical protein
MSFPLMMRRDEHAPTVLTSNKGSGRRVRLLATR